MPFTSPPPLNQHHSCALKPPSTLNINKNHNGYSFNTNNKNGHSTEAKL